MFRIDDNHQASHETDKKHHYCLYQQVIQRKNNQESMLDYIYIIRTGRFVCLFVCVYPSSAHSQIRMKLGMDTPWDIGSDIGYVRLRLAAQALRYARSA